MTSDSLKLDFMGKKTQIITAPHLSTIESSHCSKFCTLASLQSLFGVEEEGGLLALLQTLLPTKCFPPSLRPLKEPTGD